MNDDFLFALYVFCTLHHTGQSSRLYRILSRLTRYRIKLRDNQFDIIRCARTDPNGEWIDTRRYYRELKAKYKEDKK